MPMAGGARGGYTFKGDYNTTPDFRPGRQACVSEPRIRAPRYLTIALGGGERFKSPPGNGSQRVIQLVS